MPTVTRLNLVALLFVAACSNPAPEDGAESATGSIVGGRRATSFEEVALVDTSSFLCSGAVIAPHLVLTAGHCVHGASSWTVTTPYAGGQRARATRRWTAYVDAGDSVDPDSNDVAVLFLDTPIVLAQYPTLARSAVPSGTKATNVGRIHDGRASSSDLFVGRPVTLRPGSASGWRFAYVSDEIIEEGDSGGPVYTADAAHQLVAVNSGGGDGSQLLARVDLAFDRIRGFIEADGAPQGEAPGGAGGCWSPTLGSDVEEGGCVQSASSRVWFQCHAGEWYRGGDADSGAHGACTSSHPL